MKHLLDVNVLLAAIWSHHSRHAEAFACLLTAGPSRAYVVTSWKGLSRLAGLQDFYKHLTVL